MTDCTMDTVSSSPIFIRVGDRARYPVTGHTTEQAINAANDVRLDNSGWVLPNRAEYQLYPVARYSPLIIRARPSPSMASPPLRW